MALEAEGGPRAVALAWDCPPPTSDPEEPGPGSQDAGLPAYSHRAVQPSPWAVPTPPPPGCFNFEGGGKSKAG